MASRPTITGRDSSVAAAFVHAIIPRLVNVEAQKALFARFGITEGECVYCGDRATDTDHFFAIVKNAQPSGYFHTIDNLVPSCGTCNQSKSGAHWRAWITSKAKNNPASRGVPDLNPRIERLERFEKEALREPEKALAELKACVGAELWDRYWGRLTEIKRLMAAAQKEADVIQKRVEQAFKGSGIAPDA